MGRRQTRRSQHIPFQTLEKPPLSSTRAHTHKSRISTFSYPRRCVRTKNTVRIERQCLRCVKKWHVLRNRDVSHQRRTCMHAFKLESIPSQPGGGINNHGHKRLKAGCVAADAYTYTRVLIGCEIMQPDDDMRRVMKLFVVCIKQRRTQTMPQN